MDVQSVVSAAIGGENIGETIEGRSRFPINVRYPRELRDSVEKLRMLPIVTERGAQIPLSALAELTVTDGPPMLRSENARLSGWIYVDIRGRDLGSVVADAQRVVSDQVKLPPGVSLSWSGQFEYLERAKTRLALVVPFVLLIIFVLLYLTFRDIGEALLIMVSLPFSLVGRLLDHLPARPQPVGRERDRLHRARRRGGGIRRRNAAIPQAGDRRGMRPASCSRRIDEGAVQRVRPKAMTVAVIVAGLIPDHVVATAPAPR